VRNQQTHILVYCRHILTLKEIVIVVSRRYRSGPLQSEALLRRASAGIGPVAAPLAPITMACSVCGSACRSAAAAESPFCRPEEDPFLLLETTLRTLQEILRRRQGLPLRRTWIEQPYGEEEITLLEEEVLPVLQRCLGWVDELDQRLLAQQECLQRCRLEADRDALAELKVAMV